MADEELVLDIDDLDLHDMGEDSSGDEAEEVVAAKDTVVEAAAQKQDEKELTSDAVDDEEGKVKVSSEASFDNVEKIHVVKEEVVTELVKEEDPSLVTEKVADERADVEALNEQKLISDSDDKIEDVAEKVKESKASEDTIVRDPEAMKELEQLRTATDFYELGSKLLLLSRTEGAAKSAEIAKENYLKAFGRNRTPLTMKRDSLRPVA